MIIKKTLYGFKQIKYILEPLPNVEKLKREYSLVYYLGYENLDLKDFNVRHKKTPLIDLTRDKEDIFREFNSTTRNEIRQSEKIDSLRFAMDDHNIKDAYLLYSQHEQAQGRVPDRKKEFEGCIIFGAYLQNEMISAIICTHGSGYLRAKSISSKRMEKADKEFLKILGFASRRIVWELCQFGIANGYKGFDLGSINLEDPKKAGIAHFKQSFGGKLIDEYAYVYKSPAFNFFEKVAALRVYFKKIFKVH
jgi:lipid II:glycine glycyltransferase (peptidoglycan interpeptide bridge formation enzyme)